MYDSTAMDAASGFIVHIEMKNLVLVVPPGAAAIAQRMVSRWAPSVLRLCSEGERARCLTPPQRSQRLCQHRCMRLAHTRHPGARIRHAARWNSLLHWLMLLVVVPCMQAH